MNVVFYALFLFFIGVFVRFKGKWWIPLIILAVVQAISWAHFDSVERDIFSRSLRSQNEYSAIQYYLRNTREVDKKLDTIYNGIMAGIMGIAAWAQYSARENED